MRANNMLMLLVSGAVATGACDVNAPNYVAPKNPIEVGVGMPAVSSATEKVMLDFRAPSDQERQVLNDLRRMRGFPMPWIRRDDLALSVQYTITNLSDKPGVAQVLVNGANEYTSYDPAAILAAYAVVMPVVDPEDQPFVPSLIETTPIIIPGKGKVTGNIREDDFEEAALDLAAIGSWMGEFVPVLLHDSKQSRIGLEMMPKDAVVPQLYQVFVTLNANQHMRLDFVVRLRDDRGIVAAGDDRLFRPTPMAFTPPAAMMMMP